MAKFSRFRWGERRIGQSAAGDAFRLGQIRLSYYPLSVIGFAAMIHRDRPVHARPVRGSATLLKFAGNAPKRVTLATLGNPPLRAGPFRRPQNRRFCPV